MAIPLNLPQRAHIKALYHLENTNDSSDNEYNLTNYNLTTFISAYIGNGANFGPNNTNKCLKIENNLGIDGGAITLSLWVKNLSEIGANQFAYVGQQSDNTDVYYGIWYQYNSGTRRLLYRRIKQNVGAQDINYNITMGTTNWYHLCLTYDNTNLKGYINNSLINTVAASGNGSGTNTNLLTISDVNAAYAASSLIDEVIVWNTALTASEVAQVYNIIGYGYGGNGVAIGSPMIF